MARAYRIESDVSDTSRPAEHLAEILSDFKPRLILVPLDQDQSFEPKASSKRLADGRMVTTPLDDLSPFLEREEFFGNMLITPIEE